MAEEYEVYCTACNAATTATLSGDDGLKVLGSLVGNADEVKAAVAENRFNVPPITDYSIAEFIVEHDSVDLKIRRRSDNEVLDPSEVNAILGS